MWVQLGEIENKIIIYFKSLVRKSLMKNLRLKISIDSPFTQNNSIYMVYLYFLPKHKLMGVSYDNINL